MQTLPEDKNIRTVFCCGRLYYHLLPINKRATANTGITQDGVPIPALLLTSPEGETGAFPAQPQRAWL